MNDVKMVGVQCWAFVRLTAALCALCAAASLSLAASPARAAHTTQLASGGQALLPVITAADADGQVESAAAVLADYLGRIASARFEAGAGDGTIGIAVGLATDFPALQDLANELNAEGIAAREQYLLRSHARGVYLLGATPLAVRHAVWDLLYRLGHRQFFPGEAWEVVPSQSELSIAIDALEAPDYFVRRIWYGYGAWDYAAQPYRQWQERNRTASAFVLNTGHAYDGIISSHKAAFQAHPEYYGLLKGKRASSKLCVGNPELRRLVVEHALRFLQTHPQMDSVSVDPSDGGGWCQCAACAAVGTPSDRALTLANDVSQALEAHMPGKYVGMYAYNEHAPPPTIEARPRVIVSAATAFLKGKGIDDVIAGWKAKGIRQFGIREYYSVNTWDRDLPGRARGGNIAYLQRTIPGFHAQGARFMSAESSDNWAPNGLGYYLAARMLWDVDAAQRVDALKADFLDKAFGPAREPMEAFYALIDAGTRPLLSADLVGRMYRLLDRAARLARSTEVRTRIDHLILYTRYVELFRAYSTASAEKTIERRLDKAPPATDAVDALLEEVETQDAGRDTLGFAADPVVMRVSPRQLAFETLIKHVYRMRRTMMIHAKALYRDLPARDKSVAPMPDCDWQTPEPRNPWKSSEPWTRAELDTMLADGMRANPVVSFTSVAFSRDLIPAAPLALPEAPAFPWPSSGRGHRPVYTWLETAPLTLRFNVTGGLIAHYRDRGPARLRLYSLEEGEETLVDRAETPPDGMARELTLTAKQPGLHKVTVDDGMDKTSVEWLNRDVSRTIECSPDSTSRLSGRRSAWFYVPRGTRVIGGYLAHAAGATLHDADGRETHQLADNAFFEVPVEPGQDGRLWSFRDCPSEPQLMTVPPFTAATPGELLLPREIVEANSRGNNL